MYIFSCEATLETTDVSVCMYESHIIEISRKKTLLELKTQTQDREYRYIGNIWKIGNVTGYIGIVVNIGNIGDIENVGYREYSEYREHREHSEYIK